MGTRPIDADVRRIWEDMPLSPSVLDYHYNEVDKIYYAFARDCGLSSCAFWMLYDLYQGRGSLALRELCELWSFSKQTINSALKTLEAKGLIELDYEEGSRKNKVASLTDDGIVFAAERIRPVVEAEQRAFDSLSEGEGETLVRLIKKYAAALGAQMRAVRGITDEEGGDA